MGKKAVAVVSAEEKSLKQKMAASVVGSAPSLIPAPRVPQGQVPEAPGPEAVLPAIEELIGEAEDRDSLKQLVAKSLELSGRIKPLEKLQDSIRDRIKTALSTYGITAMSCDGARVSYTVQERRTLNHNKLIAAGVDTEIIVACTDISKSSTLRITPGKD